MPNGISLCSKFANSHDRKKKTARKSHGVVSEVPLWMGDVRSLGAVGGWGGIFQQRSSKSSLVKFLLSTKIQNSPPVVLGAGGLRRSIAGTI